MTDMQESVLKRIYEQLIGGNYTDIDLVFQDGSMRGSKMCLTSLSPYFEAMLTCDMLEKKTGVITLPTTSSSTFHDILKCYFLGEKVVNELNCFSLLEAAEMMMLDHLKSLCLEYLSNDLTLTTDNCIDRWRTFKVFNFEDLAIKVFQYLVKHVEDLSESGSILRLTDSEYIQLLTQCELPRDEDDVLRDVQTWITANNPSVETMVDLFKSIRFKHVSLNYLTNNVIFTDIVKAHGSLQQIVQEGLQTHSQRYDDQPSFCKRRVYNVDVMFVLNTSINVLSAVCLTDSRWYQLPAAPYNPGYWFAGAVSGKQIYITGGSENETSTMVYDVWKKTWTVGPNLKQEHIEHCMAVVDDKVYVIGGQYSGTIEQLQGQNEWNVVADLGCRRQDSCAEAVGENILVMGGTVNESPSGVFHCFNTCTHAVCTINTKLTSGKLTRSFLAMPDVYLVHYDGAVDVVHVVESDIPALTVERLAKHDGYKYNFGFVYRDGNMIVVTDNNVIKVNLREGYKEIITFKHTLKCRYISGCLSMLIPNVCLQ